MDDALRLPFWRRRRATAATASTAAEQHRGGGDEGPVRVAVVHGPIESAMARDALADAGIPAMIKQAAAGAIYGLSIGPLAAAEVWVPAPLEERARETLIGVGLLAEDDEG